jgi:hypothetical protein
LRCTESEDFSNFKPLFTLLTLYISVHLKYYVTKYF